MGNQGILIVLSQYCSGILNRGNGIWPGYSEYDVAIGYWGDGGAGMGEGVGL